MSFYNTDMLKEMFIFNSKLTVQGPVGSTNAGRLVVALSVVGGVEGAVGVVSGVVSAVDVRINSSSVTVETGAVSVVIRGVVVTG